MWRPSIAAILLVVLIALISNMVGSGPIAPRALRWLPPLSWHSALTGGADAGELVPASVATSAPEVSDGWSGEGIPPAYQSATVPVPAPRPAEPRAFSR